MTTKTVLKCSPFNSNLTRALKGSKNRLHCNVDADGMIYVCNGYFAVKLDRAEYDALVRPVTQRDPGNWVLSENGETGPDPINLVEILENAAKDAAQTITAAPLLFDVCKKGKGTAPQLVGYYSETGGFVSAFNAAYASIVSPALERKSAGSVSPMVVYSAESPIALILPVKVSDKPNILRTVRAWFVEDGQPQNDKAVEALRRDNEQLRQDYAKAHIDADALRRQVEELQAAVTAKTEQINALTDRINTQPDPQEAADDTQPQDKAAVLVDKLSALPNVTATVKGAQTAAPVVWLSGDTDAHKEAIEAMGGKWSGKRAAWYIKVA